MKIEIEVNGQRLPVEGEPLDRLLDLLRRDLGLAGTKEGCGEGECGACTVLLDGRPALACLIPLAQCEGRSIETVEHLAAGDAAPFLERLVAAGGAQCGACTPGVVVSAMALLRENPEPSRDEARRALAGNLCRCTGYEGILRAVCSTTPAADEEVRD